MQYKPKSVAALHVAIGGLPDAMHVEPDRAVSACRQGPSASFAK